MREVRRALDSHDDAKLPHLETDLNGLLAECGHDLPRGTHAGALTVLGELAVRLARRAAPPGRSPDMTRATEYLRRAKEVGGYG